MSIIRDILYLLAILVISPWLIFRRRSLRGRLGNVARREGTGRCLWVHGVSVGEAQSARVLVEKFRAAHPDWDVVVSSTTDTGLAAAARTFPGATVIRYPFDLSFAVKRALSRVRPSLVVLMEGDLWPNFIAEASKRGVPVAIVNGRLSDRHFPRSRRFRFLLAGSFAKLARVGAQTESYASRFVALGAPRERVVVTGSLKYDALPSVPPDPALLRLALGLADDEPVLVAGSTTEGEEEILLDVYSALKRDIPALRLIIVPRHPERFDAVARVIEAKGFACVRRSKASGERAPEAVILGDTMGELMAFYSLAAVAFVGKSLLAPGGGQNMIEPAGLGKAVVFGPYTSNFRETRDVLVSADAAREVKSPDELAAALRQLLADKELRAMLGSRARAVVQASRGAADRTLNLLQDVLANLPKFR